MLISGGLQAWVNRTILSNRLLVWIGLISYPLYLWHWPLLSFAAIIEGEAPKLGVRVATVVTSIILAYLTYKLIEHPMRFGQYGLIKTSILVGLMIMVGSAGYYTFKLDGLELRDFEKKNKTISDAIKDWEYPGGLIESDKYGVKFYASENKDSKIIFVGDSHVEQFGPRIFNLSQKRVLPRTIFLTGGGCPPIPNVFEDKHLSCKDLINDLMKYLDKQIGTKKIVVGGCWNCYFIEQTGPEPKDTEIYNYYYLNGNIKEQFRGGQGKELALISLRNFLMTLANKYTVYLLLDNPTGDEYNPSFILRNRLNQQFFNAQGTDVSGVRIPQEQNDLNNRLRSIAIEAGVNIIDQISNLCSNGICSRFNNSGKFIYKDRSHMRPYFVIENVNYIDEVL